MKTKDGVPYMNKTEAANIRLLLEHAKKDIGYQEGGTYGDGDKVDLRSVKAAGEAIEDIEWILERAEIEDRKPSKRELHADSAEAIDRIFGNR